MTFISNIPSLALVFLFLLVPSLPAIAECPEGKSEVVIVTPNGISKTICVSDDAIPGIENAAEHSAQFAIEPECPCLDMWDGTPYPEGTDVTGSPPSLPEVIPSGTICYGLAVTSTNHDSMGYVQVVITQPDGDIQTFAASSLSTIGKSPGYCDAYNQKDPQDIAQFESNAIFSDWKYSPGDLYTSPTMDACKALLEDRGCGFL